MALKYLVSLLSRVKPILSSVLFLLLLSSSTLFSTDHFIPNRAMMEHYRWTRGCSPSAAATVLSYTENRYINYGGLIRWYCAHPSNGANVPQLLDWLAEEMGTNAEGLTSGRNIPRGIRSVVNDICGYSYEVERVNNSIWPWSRGNDWCWELIREEIDDERPFVWSVGTSDEGHSMAAIGYTEVGGDNRVIVLDSNRTVMTYWQYNVWEYTGEPATRSAVIRVVPGGGYSSKITLENFQGGEITVSGTNQSVQWWHHGDNAIKEVDLFYSDDRGRTWQLQTDFPLPTSPGLNSYEWMVPGDLPTGSFINNNRVKILGYDASGNVRSGDGSFADFIITGIRRDMVLTGDLSFGEVTVDFTAKRIMEIHNFGNDVLTVSDIVYPEGFSGAWTGEILPYESVLVVVSFTPSEVQNYDGIIEVVSNKIGGNNIISCSGSGRTADRPLLNVAPDSLDFGIDVEEGIFVVENSGTGILKWAVEDVVYNEGNDWVTSVFPVGGNTLPGEPESVTVEVSRAGLAPGTYTAEFLIASDGGEHTVSITMKLLETLTLAVAPDIGGQTIPAQGQHGFDAGSVAEVSAVPAVGYVFSHWTGGVSSPDSANTTVTMDKQRIVTAHFVVPDFQAGDGSLENPWQITTPEQLDRVRYCAGSAHSDKYFKLMNDIDLSGYIAQGGEGHNGGMYWKPIGSHGRQFEGVFEGNGKRISGLKINRPDTDYVGLFSVVGNSGSINNLDIETVSQNTVKGRHYVGGLVGENNGFLWNCHVSGTIEGEFDVGGLVGANYGTVRRCSTVGIVSGNSGVGGLLGVTDGRVIQSHSTAGIMGNNGTGGLVGYNIYGVISECYATGPVSGANDVGGLVGFNQWDSEIRNSYAEGEVTGNSGVGGLVGSNHDGMIIFCYSVGKVSGSTNAGGLVGESFEFMGGIISSFWDTATSHQEDSAGGEGRKTDDMQSPEIFTAEGWDFESIWDIDIGTTYPYFIPKLGDILPMQGDINEDGVVNIQDVILCLRISVGLPVIIDMQEHEPEYPDWLLDLSDINEDGVVNIQDVILIMRKSLGLELF